jgi:hypothetical protein
MMMLRKAAEHQQPAGSEALLNTSHQCPAYSPKSYHPPFLAFHDSMKRETAIKIFINLSCFLTAILVVVLTFSCKEPKNLQTVSGFYGPGAVLAWLVSGATTIITGELRFWFLTIWRQIHPALNQHEARRQIIEFDSGLFAFISYAVVACVDTIYRYMYDQNSPSHDAASYVVRLCLIIVYIPLFFAAEGTFNDFEETRNGFPLLNQRRKWAWRLLWVLCLACFALRPVDAEYKRYVHHTTLGSWLLVQLPIVMWFMTSRSSVSDSLRRQTRFFYLQMPWYFFNIGVWSADSLGLCDGSLSFPFPKTLSNLTDLDQWFALVCSVILLFWPACNKLLYVWVRERSS